MERDCIYIMPHEALELLRQRSTNPARAEFVVNRAVEITNQILKLVPSPDSVENNMTFSMGVIFALDWIANNIGVDLNEAVNSVGNSWAEWIKRGCPVSDEEPPERVM